MIENSSKRLTLVEMLEHLKELSDAKFGLDFIQASYQEFKREVLLQEKLSDFYIAIVYIKTLQKGNEKILGLDLEELKEILQNRVYFLRSKKETPKHIILVDDHIADMIGAFN